MKSKVRQVDRIISGLYAGTLDQQAWNESLTAIARLVGGQGPYLLSLVPSTGTVLRDEIHGYDPAVLKEFRQQWACKDIRVPAGLTAPLYEPVTEAKILPRGGWERSEIFNEFLYAHDMGWFLAVWIHKSRSKLTALSIQGTHDHGPFSEQDVATVRRVMPHVRRALEIKEKLEQYEIRHNSLKRVFDSAPFGYVILDNEGYIVDASPVATAALESAHALRHESKNRHTFADPARRHLMELVRSSLQQGKLREGIIHVRRGHDRPPLCLVLSPLPDLKQTWLAPKSRWLLLVFDPARSMAAKVDLVRRELSLTLREAEIATHLANGSDLGKIADQLQIRPHTVRSHLKSIFAKTGLHSQSELLLRVIKGPAWRPTAL